MLHLYYANGGHSGKMRFWSLFQQYRHAWHPLPNPLPHFSESTPVPARSAEDGVRPIATFHPPDVRLVAGGILRDAILPTNNNLPPVQLPSNGLR